MKKIFAVTIILLAVFFVSISGSMDTANDKKEASTTTPSLAMFAGGCFWCMEKPFEKLNGVGAVTSGYAGGSTENPTYKNYERGGHIEVVKIEFDSSLISYQKLLDVFWRQIDPTDAGGQFVDRGHAYSTGIFYYNEEQKKGAEQSKMAIESSKVFQKPVITPIVAAPTFFPAEQYHQDYYKKNPIRYKIYRSRSGRDDFLEKTWKDQMEMKTSSDDLKQKLTPLQYQVTQKNGTEPPYKNTYWDNKRPGIYVDIVSGEPLFSSTDKYDSKTGWPSFSKPLVAGNIIERDDIGWMFMKRIEVRSKKGDSHLGHVFNDGPQPTGLRYCINSASLLFIPAQELEQEGFEQYASLFAAQH